MTTAKERDNNKMFLALVNLELNRQGKLHLLAVERARLIEILQKERIYLIKWLQIEDVGAK